MSPTRLACFVIAAWCISWGLGSASEPLVRAQGTTTLPAAKQVPIDTASFKRIEAIYLFRQRNPRIHFALDSVTKKVIAFHIPKTDFPANPGDRILLQLPSETKPGWKVHEVSLPKVIGTTTLPSPEQVEIQDISSAKVSEVWAKTMGFVTAVRFLPRRDVLEIELHASKPILLHLDVENTNSIQPWENRFLYKYVTVTGCAVPWIGPTHRDTPCIKIGSENNLRTVSNENLFEGPSVPIEETVTPKYRNRIVKIEGIVLEPKMHEVKISDNSTELALAISNATIAPNDYLEVLGVGSLEKGQRSFTPIAYRAFEQDNGKRDKRILLEAGELKKFSPKELTDQTSVRFFGRVTAVIPSLSGFFMEDSTGGCFVSCLKSNLPKVGVEVQVRGHTEQKLGVPFVRAIKPELLAKDLQLPCMTLTSSEWLNSSYEGRRVELQGVVRSITPRRKSGAIVWRIARANEILLFHTSDSSSIDYVDTQKYLGTTIRLKGVFSQLPISDSSDAEKHIWASDGTDDVTILQKSEDEKISNLGDLKTLANAHYSRNEQIFVEVSGHIIGFGEQNSVYIEDEQGGIRVDLPDFPDMQLGNRITVSGLYSPGKNEFERAYLKEARVIQTNTDIRRTWPPKNLDNPEDSQFNDRLVTGSGVVQECLHYPGYHVLVVSSHGRTYFLRILDAALSDSQRESLVPDMYINFTGIYTPEFDERSGKSQEVIRLRLLQDIVTLHIPPRWRTLHTVILGCIIGLICCLLLIWGWVANLRLRDSQTIILQQKHREEQLEEKYRELFENANDFMFTLDINGRITSINNAGERLMGYARGELLGRSLTDFVASDDRNTVESMIESDEPVTYEIVLFNQSLKELCLEISSRPVVDSENVAIHIVGIGRDITRRKLAEWELKRAFRVLRSHIENSPLGIIEWDRGFRVTRWSRQAEVIFGWRAEEVLFRHPSEWNFIHEEDSAAVEKVIAALLNKANRNYSFNRNYNKSGNIVYCEWYNSALVDEKGELVSVLSLVLDVTPRVEGEEERRKLEENIKQVQKMEAVGRLAGGVAHDFNNLLTIINGNSHMLLAERLPRDHFDLVSQIRQAGEKAAGLTRQLLAFGRKQISAPKEVDLNYILRDLHDMLKRMAGEHVQVIYDLQSSLPLVLIDPTMMEQIVYNLIVNARDAMPTGGKIQIRSRAIRESHVVRLEFEDTGTGMDEKTKAKIFEPFFTTKAMGKGTGLGLATVYSVVQQANGIIDVSSTPGVGTTFRVDLPISSSRIAPESSLKPLAPQVVETPPPSKASTIVQPIQPPAAVSDNPEQHRDTVLLVEDEDGLRLLARRVLEMNGYRVIPAADGNEALEIYRKKEFGHIDLLITDVMMPGISGVQLVEQLRTEESDMRVIFMSGYTDDEVIHQGVMMEEVQFLQKPFTPPVFMAKVRKVMSLETSA